MKSVMDGLPDGEQTERVKRRYLRLLERVVGLESEAAILTADIDHWQGLIKQSRDRIEELLAIISEKDRQIAELRGAGSEVGPGCKTAEKE